MVQSLIWKGIMAIYRPTGHKKTNPIQTHSKPISSKSALGLPQVSADEWGWNENFVRGFIVPAESAKMAQKLAFGNFLKEGGKKLNSCDKAI